MIYEVEGPDGVVYEVDAPTPQDAAKAIAGKYKQKPTKSRTQANVEYATGLAGEIAQGASFGFSDELEGAVAAAPKLLDSWEATREAYTTARDAARARSGEFREDFPKTAIAANLAGGVGSGLGMARGAVGAAMANAPATSGAILGGAAGYGASEAETPQGMAADTALGAVTGGVIGRLAQPTANAIGEAVTAPGRLATARAASRPQRTIVQRIARDDMSLDKVAANLRKMPAGATIADAAGDNTARLAEEIVAMPGKGAQNLRALFNARQSKAAARVDSAINAALKIKGDFYAAMSAIQDDLANRAKPFYDAAYEKPVLQSPTLKGVMSRLDDAAPDVLESARRKARLDGQVTGTTLRYYDYVKRALDDKIGAAIRAGEKDNARVWQGLKRTLVDELDNRVPEYGIARSIYSDDAGMKAALEAGRDFMREDAEMIAANMQGMSEAERQMFRMGAARALRDRILSRPDSADVYKAFFNKPLMREKIAAIFPDKKSFAKLQRAMLNEQRMFQTSAGATGNSATARRLLGARDLATDPETAMDAATGGVKFATLNAARKYVRSRLGPLANESVRDQIAAILMEGDPAKRAAALAALDQPPVVAPYRPGAINNATGRAAPAIGGVAGAGAVGLTSNRANGQR